MRSARKPRKPTTAEKPYSPTLLERMTDQARFDPKLMEQFQAAHGGRTPMEQIMHDHPEAAEAIAILRRKS